ncbi:dihydrodipicolinate reductase [Chloroflexota bacterium]
MDQQNVINPLLNPARKYRVVQWATGNVGTGALRAIIQHPNLTLVGVWVHSEAKAGRDAGELCGLGPVGVTATRDIDEIIALKPDCIVYMQEGFNFDDVCKLLASGANIVTSRWEINSPTTLDPALRERVEEACRRGGTSIHGSGASPGFITEALPLVLLSLQRRLDCLTIDEFADLSSRNSPELLFDVVGFGKPPGAVNEHMLAFAKGTFSPSLSFLANAISMPLDTIEVSGEFATARHKTEIAAGVLEAGTVAAQRITISGMRGGRPLLRMRTNWYCTTDVEPSLNLRETGWRVLLEGDAPLDIDIRFPVPLEEWAAVSPGLTAHRPINAIPYVCAAAPGIRTTADLPPIIAMLG